MNEINKKQIDIIHEGKKQRDAEKIKKKVYSTGIGVGGSQIDGGKNVIIRPYTLGVKIERKVKI